MHGSHLSSLEWKTEAASQILSKCWEQASKLTCCLPEKQLIYAYCLSWTLTQIKVSEKQSKGKWEILIKV